MGTNEDLNAKKVKFDEAIVAENQPNRITFALSINNVFGINPENKAKF